MHYEARRSITKKKDDPSKGRVQRIFFLLIWKVLNVHISYKYYYFKIILFALAGLPILMIIRIFGVPEIQKKVLYNVIEIDSLDRMREKLIKVQNETTKDVSIIEKILFTPKYEPYEKIIALAAKKLKLKDGYQKCETEKDIELLIQYKRVFAAVVFHPKGNASVLPNVLDYELRFSSFLNSEEFMDNTDIWQTNELYPPLTGLLKRGPRTSEDNTDFPGVPPGYIQEGFVPLQHAIAMSYLELKTGQNSNFFPHINMLKFPCRQYVYDKMFFPIKLWLPVVFIIAYMVPSYFMVSTITDEFERGFMKALKINCINWCAWAVVLFVIQAFISFIIILILNGEWYGGAIFKCSEMIPVLVFLFCYIWANCAFVLMLTVVVIRKRSNLKSGILLHLLTFLPFPLLFLFYFDIPLEYKLIGALFLNTGLALGVNIIINLEDTNEGFVWKTYNKPLFAADGLSVLHVSLTLILSSLIWIGILLYWDNIYSLEVSAINLEKESMSKKWYYPLNNLNSFIKRQWNRRPRHFSAFKKLGVYIIQALTTHEDDLYIDAQTETVYKWPSTRLRRVGKSTITVRNTKISSDPDIAVYQRKETIPLRPLILSDTSTLSSAILIEKPPKHRFNKRARVPPAYISSTDSFVEHVKTTEKSFDSPSSVISIEPYSELSDGQVSVFHDLSSFESEAESDVHLPSLTTSDEPITEVHAGIQLLDVSKVIGNTTYLKNINMTIHPKEITIILVHEHSAGRLLLSKIIGGVIKPSSGQVIVNGINLSECKDMDLNDLITIVRSQSIVLNQLTVCENFYFYLNLRGVNSSKIDREISKYIKLMHLNVNKIDQFAEYLNPNMARRLSLCCALCGGKHSIIVDEPTMGLDQNNRHYIWEILRSESRSRVIIVNTSYHDEAEVLGDRIALINCGQLMCYGLTKDLILKFCNNYHLICEKSATKEVNWEVLMQLLYNRFSEGARIVKHTGIHINISIPADHGIQFAQFMGDLERFGEENGITNFWLQLKTLPQVFRCSSTVRKEFVENSLRFSINSPTIFDEASIEINNHKRLTLSALLTKRFIFVKHYFWMPLVMMLLFAIFVGMGQHSSHLINLPRMNLSVYSYTKTVAMMKVNSDVKESMISHNIAKGYANYQKFLIHSREKHDHTFKIVRGRRQLIQYILFQELLSETSVESFFVAGADIYEKVITCFWNNKLLHASPISLNLVHNAIARHYIGPDAEIRVTNFPVPFTNRQSLDLINTGFRLKMGLGPTTIMIICLFVVLMIVPVICDHKVLTRHLIYMGGTNDYSYWAIQFICDITFYIIGIFYLVALLLIYDWLICYRQPKYDDHTMVLLLILVLILFGLAVFPFIYILIVIFGQYLYGYIGSVGILMGSCILLVLIVPTLIMEIEVLVNLYYLFCWSPSVNLRRALKLLHVERALLRSCEILGGCAVIPDCCDMTLYLSYQYPGILIQIITLIVQTVAYSLIFFIMIHIDTKWINWWSKRRERSEDKSLKNKDYFTAGILDIDVFSEKKRVNKFRPWELKQMPLVLKGVSKRFNNRVFIRDVTLAVEQFDIFGIVGIFGSGKSKIIELATGVLSIDRGDIYIYGVSVRNDQKMTRKMIAFCPRSNSLIENMTVLEILYFYCAIHGRKSLYISTIIRELALNLCLETELHKLVKDLCFSTRRKIMIAIAITSTAQVIMMDEPTRGLDAEDRLLVWRMINVLHDRGRTIIMATDSMDECIALCKRIAIMVNGSLISIGSVNYLTSKFSKGSILRIRTSGPISYEGRRYSIEQSSTSSRQSHLGYSSLSSNENGKETLIQSTSIKSSNAGQNIWIQRCQGYRNIVDFIHEYFPQAKLQEEYRNTLTYYIPFKTIPLSRVFEAMEAAKGVFNLENYRVTRTSLMQMYDNFVRGHVRFWVKPESKTQSQPNFFHG